MPAFSTALIWTKASVPPSSGTMKPKPLSTLKNFTLPMGMDLVLSGRTGREWRVPLRAGGRKPAGKTGAGRQQTAGRRHPSTDGGAHRAGPGRAVRGAAAEIDAVA